MTSAVKILLVDDVGQNLVALDALLRRADVLPLHATNGSAALELLLEHDIALALIDVQMPEMDGFELAEFMRGSPRTRHVPIIFLTATDRDTKRMFKGYEAGAVDFLYKPFDPHILSSKAEVFIQLHQQKRQLAAQVEAMKQLIRTNDMFVAVLGHDLRNPLSSVMVNAEILRRSVGSDVATSASTGEGMTGRIQTAAERITSSGQRMARMIDQLLDVARVRAGQLQIQPERLDLKVLAQSIVDEFLGLTSQPVLQLEVNGDTHGVWDRGSLAQILSNLIGNALRHGDATRPITVEVDGSSTQAVRLRISNGGEIPEAVQPHLFSPFRSGADAHDLDRHAAGAATVDAAGHDNVPVASIATAPQITGTETNLSAMGKSAGLGLGLYIVHELVRMHAGTIEACCTAGSAMTTFEVTLPRHAAWHAVRETVDAPPRDAAAFAISTAALR